MSALAERMRSRAQNAALYRDAYRRYAGMDEAVRFAPFQVLAAGEQTFETRDGAGLFVWRADLSHDS